MLTNSYFINTCMKLIYFTSNTHMKYCFQFWRPCFSLTKINQSPFDRYMFETLQSPSDTFHLCKNTATAIHQWPTTYSSKPLVRKHKARPIQSVSKAYLPFKPIHGRPEEKSNGGGEAIFSPAFYNCGDKKWVNVLLYIYIILYNEFK